MQPAAAPSRTSVFQLLSSSTFTGKGHAAPPFLGPRAHPCPAHVRPPQRCTVCPTRSHAPLPAPQLPHGTPVQGQTGGGGVGTSPNATLTPEQGAYGSGRSGAAGRRALRDEALPSWSNLRGPKPAAAPSREPRAAAAPPSWGSAGSGDRGGQESGGWGIPVPATASWLMLIPRRLSEVPDSRRRREPCPAGELGGRS